MKGIAQHEILYGTWKLVEIRGDLTVTFGKDGRTLLLITAEKRPHIPDLTRMTDQERVDLFRTMLAYGGRYTFDGKELKINVDISWNENWSGTELVRFAKIAGNRLELSTPVYPSTVHGKPTSTVLIWEKLA